MANDLRRPRMRMPKVMTDFVKKSISTLVATSVIEGQANSARDMLSALQVGVATAEALIQAREDFFAENPGAFRDKDDEPDIRNFASVLEMVNGGRLFDV